MLQIKTYTREELVKECGVSTLDGAKKKVKRAGYTFEESGRGNTYTMTIIALPDGDNDSFKDFCINTLNLKPQTDFDNFKKFVRAVYEDTTFLTFRTNIEISNYLTKNYNCTICDSTLRTYLKILEENNLLGKSTKKTVFYNLNPKTNTYKKSNKGKYGATNNGRFEYTFNGFYKKQLGSILF